MPNQQIYKREFTINGKVHRIYCNKEITEERALELYYRMNPAELVPEVSGSS